MTTFLPASLPAGFIVSLLFTALLRPPTSTCVIGECRCALTVFIQQQYLDTLLGCVKDLRALSRELHAFFESLQRLLQRKVAALQLLDEAAQLQQHLIETLRVGLGHIRSLPPASMWVNRS